MPQQGEGVAITTPSSESPCNHVWVEISSHNPEDGKTKNSATAAKVSTTDPPSAKGYLFENHCIDTNMEKLEIEKVSVMYQCDLCKQNQEVDIVGKDQIAECKNKKKSDMEQAQRLKDIQTKVKGDGSPLAKINEGHKKSKRLEKTYGNAGFETELVPGFS